MYVQIFRGLLKTRNKTSEMIRKRNENDKKSFFYLYLNLKFFVFPFSLKCEVVNNKTRSFSRYFSRTRITMSSHV